MKFSKIIDKMVTIGDKVFQLQEFCSSFFHIICNLNKNYMEYYGLKSNENVATRMIEINYPRINSRVCSSHLFLLDSGYSVLRLPPPRLHRRAVDDARLPAKFTRQILI